MTTFLPPEATVTVTPGERPELPDGPAIKMSDVLEVSGMTVFDGRWVREDSDAPACPDPSRHEPTEAAPAGWDRIEAGTEDPDWANADDQDPGADADRALERMELDNDRARIDLEREKLAHARLVASDELRVVALQTARSVVDDHKFMTAVDRGNALEALYRRFIGLLEEPDPANGPPPVGEDRIDRTPGDVRLYDHVEQRPV